LVGDIDVNPAALASPRPRSGAFAHMEARKAAAAEVRRPPELNVDCYL
jgi:hypothetical protein